MLKILISSFFLIGLCCGCAQSIHSNYSRWPIFALDESENSLSKPQQSINQNLITQRANPVNLTESHPSNTEPDIKIASLQPTYSTHVKIEKSQHSSEHEEDQSPSQRMQPLMDEALDFCQASQDFWQKGELENAIEALDHAYSLILKADVEDLPLEFLQQKEDLRYTVSKRILEIYASRYIVANGSHDAIPLIMNRHISSEIYLFTKGREKEFFIESYKRSGRYRPNIVSALKEAGLPPELSWLPLIESGFKVNALSPARALGLWQFIPSTGYKFGLMRDHYIDERMDPDKSTEAAIGYLKELHHIFGDWTTALAAYNCGEDRVLRVIQSQNVNYLDDFWDLYRRLPRETSRYVPRFLATLHILKDPKKYGIDTITVDKPLEYEKVSISKSVHLKDVAKKIGVTEETMKDLNPELRYKIAPPPKYPLKIPVDKKGIFYANLDEIPIVSKPKQVFTTHRIRRGETLSIIAEKHRVSVESIVCANSIDRQNYIITGQTLRIPKSAVVYQTQKQKSLKKEPAIKHVVKKGDSLWIIAKRYGATTQQILEHNHLQNSRLYIGQVLMVPDSESATATTEGLKIYQVRQGDNPFYISTRHSMELERFLRINHLTPKSKIFPGQKLFVE